jgi:hypothetical protein
MEIGVVLARGTSSDKVPDLGARAACGGRHDKVGVAGEPYSKSRIRRAVFEGAEELGGIGPIGRSCCGWRGGAKGVAPGARRVEVGGGRWCLAGSPWAEVGKESERGQSQGVTDPSKGRRHTYTYHMR